MEKKYVLVIWKRILQLFCLELVSLAQVSLCYRRSNEE